MNRTTNWFQRRKHAAAAALALTPGSRKVTGQTRRKRGFTAHVLETLEDRRLLSGGPTIYTVTDTSDSATDTGSLRYAITQANTNANPAGSEIEFGSLFNTPHTITIGSALPSLAESGGTEAIIGPAAGVTIARAAANPADFDILTIGSSVTASLSNLTITGGMVSGHFGGGIDNLGSLSLTDSTITGNSTNHGGGGIYNGGTAALTDCTITGNYGSFSGGIYNGGTATLTACTISNNSANSAGGFDNDGTATLTDTIVAGNTAKTDPDVYGSFSSAGYNLIGVQDGSNGWITTDLTGSQTTPLDPKLAKLGDYGGPTQTMALLPESPALGTGVAVSGVNTDQRGFSRGPTVDIGAFQATSYVGQEFVNTAADWAGTAQLTLRQALNLANTWQGTETITFDPTVFATAQTITLGSALPDLADTTGTETITGPAAGVTVARAAANPTRFGILAIDGGVPADLSNLTVTGGNDSRPGGGIDNNGTATFTDCTISGNSATIDGGGGVYNNGKATFTNCTISGNSATLGGGICDDINGTATLTDCTLSGNSALYGGGVDNNGKATLTDCTISRNSASFNGGGVYNSGKATLTDCTISRNTASYGGGDYNNGTATVTDCTFSDNSASSDGGGIYNNYTYTATLTVTDCTMSGNSAVDGDGGAIVNLRTATLTDCTLSANTASSDGGGIYNSGTATITGTIVAGNTAPTDPDVVGSFSSAGYNLIGVKDGSTGWITTDLTGSQTTPLDPKLASLGDYGGPTQTMALLPESQALGKGVAVPGVTTDQRGFSRGATVDIGAFQTTGYLGQEVIDTAGDSAGPAQLTLRQALILANTWKGTETITFDPTAFATPQTITLGSALPDLADSTGTETIIGPAAGVTVARAAANPTRFGILAISSGVTADLSNLTVTGGNDSGPGGGVYNNGTATFTDCTLSGNSATFGGGIYDNNKGSATFTDCTISGNSATFRGGGIFNNGTAILTDCTISGNSAIFAGGIYDNNKGTAIVTDCTISGNSALYGAGGIYNGGTATITGTIVSGNTAATDPDVDGSYGGINDLVGGDAMLAPLGNYGGPTQTMPLLPGSPALGAGVAVSGVTTDQRGFSRGATVDVGAFQATGNDSDPLVVNTWLDTPGPGQLSLRQAINLAAATDVTQNIVFDPTAFATPRTLVLASTLPTIPDGFTIDGRSAERIEGTPNVVLHGTGGSTVPDGLILAGSFATIAGLEIANFPVGILIESSDAFANLITQDVIVGNAVGVELAQGASSNIIGGMDAGAGNVVSGNGTGIVITDAGTTGNLVAGNLIGGDETSPVAAGNTGDGIDIANGATGNLIGASGAGNSIAFNQGAGVNVDGTSVGNLVRFNQITGNTQPGIVNAAGAFPNPPVLFASILPSEINGTLAGTAGQTDTIDFYANPVDDTPARPQGRDYLGSIRVVTDMGGNAAFSFTFTPVAGEPVLTATATDVNGSTSEFSAPVDAGLFATGLTLAATVGVPFQGTVARFTADPGSTAADFTATIDWGDGAANSGVVSADGAGFDVTGSHTYTAAGTDPISVTITDSGSGAMVRANSTVTVVPPSFSLTAAGQKFAASTKVPFQGTVASFTSNDPSATAADFNVMINYGDDTGTFTGTVLAAPGGFIVLGAHTFTTADPTEPVTVTITNTVDGSQATANSLANVASLLTPLGQSPQFVAGTLYSRVVASFTDSNPQAFPGQFTATIAWGDGSANTTVIVSADGAGFDVTGSHTYNFPGTSTVTEPVTVTITDTLTGAMITANSTATVAPVPITIQTKNFSVKGGVLFSGTVATFTDGDPRINPAFYTASINWGDGSPNSTGVITGTNPFTVTSSHTFAPFQNIDLVTITITDQNERTATGVDRVVDPPAVLDVQAGGLTLSPNKPFVGTVATFSDSGPSEPVSDYTATINWGKGRKAAGMITGSNGQFVVSAKHKFARFSGAKPVTVTVTDITDGRTVSASESASYVVRIAKVSKSTRPVKIAEKSHR